MSFEEAPEQPQGASGTTMAQSDSEHVIGERKPKVWLITGTSSGLGRLLVEDVLKRGDYVIASARKIESIKDLETAADVEAQTQDGKGRCRALTLDVTSPIESIKQTIAQAVSFWGRIDVVVHNAGTGMLGLSEEVGVEGYRTQFAVNFFGPLNITHAALPYMRSARSGTIVFITSRCSWRPGSLMLGTYASSKAALSAAAEAIGVEVAPFGIRVLEACPGGLRTPNWDNVVLLPTSKHAPTADSSPSPGHDQQPSSIERVEPHIADYAPFRTAHVEFMSTLSGTQPGDPARAAAVVVDAVRAEGVFEGYRESTQVGLKTSSNPWAAAQEDGHGERAEVKILPDLVILGGDAQRDVRSRCAKVLRELEQWGDVGRSIDFAAPGEGSF